MKNLLKADFYRILRTKIVYISMIIAVGLPLFIAGILALTEAALVSGVNDPTAPSLGSSMGDTLISYTFNPVFSFSFVFAIFPVIVIMMDFGNGTIRNKVIHGYTRHQIFAAHFIATLIYSFILTALSAATNAICAVAFFGVKPISAEMVPIYVLYYVIGFLGTLLTASIGCGLALSLLNAGAIILTVVSHLFLSYLGTILDMIFTWQKVPNTKYILSFLPTYFTSTLSGVNMAYQTTEGAELVLIIEAIAGILILSGAFYALGTFVFNKRDFK